MKKKLSVLISMGLLTVLLVPMLALAQEEPPAAADLWAILDTATRWFYGIFLALAVLMVIYAGFMFLTAGGDAEKISKAREALMYAVVGVVVALLARSIVPIAKALLGL